MAMLDDFDDAEFAELFGAFDDVVASADLKERTLAAVRGDQGAVALDATVVSPYVKVPDVDRTAPFTKRGRATRPVRRRMNVGVIFAAVFAVLIVFGVASWFLPVSSVRIEQDEFVVDLGVNLYGVTVQATAEGDEGKAVLESQPVTNLRRDEAERRLRSAFDRMRPEPRDQDMESGPTDGATGDVSGKGTGDATGSGTGTYTPERPSGTDTTPNQQQQPQQSQQPQQPQQQQQNPNQGGQAPQQQAQPEGANAQPGAGQPQGSQQPQGQQPSTQDANPGTREPNQGNGGGQPSQNDQGGQTRPGQSQTPQQQMPNPQPGQDAGASSDGQASPTINRNTEDQAPQTPQGTGDGGAQPATPSEGQPGDLGGGEPQMNMENGATPGDAGGVPTDGGEGMPSGGGDAGGPAGADAGGM